jgi:hypothetical protein
MMSSTVAASAASSFGLVADTDGSVVNLNDAIAVNDDAAKIHAFMVALGGVSSASDLATSCCFPFSRVLKTHECAIDSICTGEQARRSRVPQERRCPFGSAFSLGRGSGAAARRRGWNHNNVKVFSIVLLCGVVFLFLTTTVA